MKRRFILHGGAFKTGTTSLAYFLGNHRNFLQHHNIYIPNTGKWANLYKYRLRHFFLNPSLLDALIEEVREHADSDVFMLDETAMTAGSLLSKFVSRVSQALPEHDFKILFYVPRIDNYLRQLYYQSGEDGLGGGNWDVSYGRFCENQLKNQKLLPSQAIVRFRETVGRDNLIVRFYDRGMLINGDAIDDVMSILNVDVPAKISLHKAHKSVVPSLFSHLGRQVLSDCYGEYFHHNIFEMAGRISQLSVRDGESLDLETVSLAAQERARIEREYPEYGKLYDNRDIDLKFPGLDHCDYESVFHSHLLYDILHHVEQLSLQAFNSQLHLLVREFNDRKCYFWGFGEVYAQNKIFFAGAKPVAFIVDILPESGMKDSVDGVPVRMAEEVLSDGERLPILIFAHPGHAYRIVNTIAIRYPAFLPLAFVAPGVNSFLRNIALVDSAG